MTMKEFNQSRKELEKRRELTETLNSIEPQKGFDTSELSDVYQETRHFQATSIEIEKIKKNIITVALYWDGSKWHVL